MCPDLVLQIWSRSGSFGAPKSCGSKFGSKFGSGWGSPSRACPNLVGANLVVSPIGACRNLAIQIWRNLVQFGVCPDLVSIWFRFGSPNLVARFAWLSEFGCWFGLWGSCLGGFGSGGLVGLRLSFSAWEARAAVEQCGAASGVFLLTAEQHRSSCCKGTASFENCVAKSRKVVPGQKSCPKVAELVRSGLFNPVSLP